MANESNFNASTDYASVSGVVKDNFVALPNVPPTGLQAIGPRVTFHFVEGEWSSDNSYQYYDVVKYNDYTYIAIQNVPTGIEITNTEYWFQWADPNAQIMALENLVQTFDARIAKNTDDIETANTEITDIKGKISNPTQNIGWVGDSYSDARVTNWPWVAKVGYCLNSNIANVATAGAGFLAGNTFISQLDQLHTQMPSPDAVVLFGGENDMYSLFDADNLREAINAFFDKYNELFDGVPLHIFGYTATSAFTDRIRQYDNILRYAAMFKNIRNSFHNVYTTLFDMQGYQSADDMHPSASGAQYYAEVFTSALNGGTTRMQGMRPTVDTQPSDYVTISNKNLVTIKDGMFTFNPVKITIDEQNTERAIQLYNKTKLLGIPTDISFNYNLYQSVTNGGASVGYWIANNQMTMYVTPNKAYQFNVQPMTFNLRNFI